MSPLFVGGDGLSGHLPIVEGNLVAVADCDPAQATGLFLFCQLCHGNLFNERLLREMARPRVRDRAGKEVSLESWQALRDGNLLLEWALNLMVLNVSTRKYHRAVRLPEGDLAKARGDGTSKSAVSRRFVALSRKKMKAWLASDLSEPTC